MFVQIYASRIGRLHRSRIDRSPNQGGLRDGLLPHRHPLMCFGVFQPFSHSLAPFCEGLKASHQQKILRNISTQVEKKSSFESYIASR